MPTSISLLGRTTPRAPRLGEARGPYTALSIDKLLGAPALDTARVSAQALLRELLRVTGSATAVEEQLPFAPFVLEGEEVRGEARVRAHLPPSSLTPCHSNPQKVVAHAALALVDCGVVSESLALGLLTEWRSAEARGIDARVALYRIAAAPALEDFCGEASQGRRKELSLAGSTLHDALVR